MRTSMNLPDALLEEARARASAEHTTVTSLVIEGLRDRLASRAEAAGSSVTLPSQHLGTALVDISDNAAVRDVLDRKSAERSDRP